MVRYVLCAGQVRKFWEVAVEKKAVTVRSGTIGKEDKAKASTKLHATGPKAKEAMAKLVADKLRDGYVLDDGSIDTSPAKARKIPAIPSIAFADDKYLARLADALAVELRAEMPDVHDVLDRVRKKGAVADHAAEAAVVAHLALHQAIEPASVGHLGSTLRLYVDALPNAEDRAKWVLDLCRILPEESVRPRRDGRLLFDLLRLVRLGYRNAPTLLAEHRHELAPVFSLFIATLHVLDGETVESEERSAMVKALAAHAVGTFETSSGLAANDRGYAMLNAIDGDAADALRTIAKALEVDDEEWQSERAKLVHDTNWLDTPGLEGILSRWPLDETIALLLGRSVRRKYPPDLAWWSRQLASVLAVAPAAQLEKLASEVEPADGLESLAQLLWLAAAERRADAGENAARESIRVIRDFARHAENGARLVALMARMGDTDRDALLGRADAPPPVDVASLWIAANWNEELFFRWLADAKGEPIRAFAHAGARHLGWEAMLAVEPPSPGQRSLFRLHTLEGAALEAPDLDPKRFDARAKELDWAALRRDMQDGSSRTDHKRWWEAAKTILEAVTPAVRIEILDGMFAAALADASESPTEDGTLAPLWRLLVPDDAPSLFASAARTAIRARDRYGSIGQPLHTLGERFLDALVFELKVTPVESRFLENLRVWNEDAFQRMWAAATITDA